MPTSSEILQAIAPQKNYLTDETLLRPTKLLSMWDDWHQSVAWRPQRFLSLLAGCCTLGILMGNRYRGHTGLKANPYIIALAGSAKGKECPRKMGQHLLELLGRSNSIGADVWGSDGGVESDLMESPEILWFIDEMNQTLRDWKNPNCPSYKTNVKRLLLTTHNGGSYQGKCLKNKEERNIIKEPCPGIFATCQPGQFFDLVDKQLVEEGFMNRCYVFNAGLDYRLEYGRTNKLIPEGISPEMISELKRALSLEGNRFTKIMGIPTPIIRIPITDEGREIERVIHDDCEERIYIANKAKDTLTVDLIGRTMEKIARLAMIHAWTDDWDNPRIGPEALIWAARMTRVAESTIIDHCPMVHTTNDGYDKEYQHMLNTISHFPEGITTSQLAARHRLPKNRFESILYMMIQADAIEIVTGNNGKGKRFKIKEAAK